MLEDELELVGAIKIMDGLFVGDEFASQVPNSILTDLSLGNLFIKL
jgi:hypothetical protein